MENLSVKNEDVLVVDEEPRLYRYSKDILSGTLAGITITLIGHPFDTLKVRLQVQSAHKKVYNGLVDCFMKTIRWEGIGGLYKGVASPLTGQLFMRTALFTSYYESLEYLKKHGQVPQLNKVDYYIAGFVGGAMSAFVDGPLDLVKSKLQIQIIQKKSGVPIEHEYRNVFHCGREIIAKYGLRGILQGFGPTLARNSLGFGIYFGTNQILKNMMLAENQCLEDIESYKIILSGAIAGMIFWICIFNIDVVKSAMMADHIDRSQRVYTNMFDCVKKLYRNEGGYARLWKGFSPCFLRSAPGNGAMLYVVDITRHILPSYSTLTWI